MVAPAGPVTHMSRLPLTIRAARIEDAPALASAERAVATKPGFLVSQPGELADEHFVEKITALAAADNGRYVVAETDGRVIGHGITEVGRWQRRVKLAAGQYLDDIGMELFVT